MATLLDAKELIASSADIGFCEDDPRLAARINEAQRRLIDHLNFLIRRDEYDRPPVVWSALTSDASALLLDHLDATKLMCLAIWREENNRLDLAGQLEARALAMVERWVVQLVETASKTGWKAKLQSSPKGTFGWVKARLGLDCAAMNLRYTPERLGRLVNDAEERIMMNGKPVGSIEEFKFDLEPDGTFYLPDYIEAVLFASMDGIPAPVFARAYDYLENGPGYQMPEGFGYANLLVDRGIENGRRRYFVRNSTEGCVRLLCKRKFKPHAADTEKLVVQNYPALKEMALAVAFQAEDPNRSVTHSALSLQLIDAELAQYRGGARHLVNFQVHGMMKPPVRLR